MNSSFTTADHVVWDCLYHIVIAPKYRKKILYGDVRVQIGKILRKLAERKGVRVLEGTACPDHVHLVLSIPPKYSVAHVMGFLKGKSAIMIHNSFPRKKFTLGQKSFWSGGYFVRTAGIDREIVEKYVRDQWKKDQYFDGPELDLHW